MYRQMGRQTVAHSLDQGEISTIMIQIDNTLRYRMMGKQFSDLSFALHDRAIVTIGKTRLTDT